VILLDELEKAHRDVAMILLQILDEGSVTDSQGRKVDFRNTIICLTSNLGSEAFGQPGSCGPDGVVTDEARRAVLAATEGHFPPELLNRLDATLVFNKLSRASILQVVDLRLRDVQARLSQRRITLDIDAPARAWLAEQGYSEMYGARAIARVVRTKVLFPLAQKLLSGTIRDGDVVRVRADGVRGEVVVHENHAPDAGGPRELQVEEDLDVGDAEQAR